ncbi:MAG: sulfur carrier protein ThiS [bacterium]|nr:sulfur carrier protein ThiS [bacterium]
MKITVNGTPKDVPEGLSLSALLAELELDPSTIVVERNRAAVSRSDFAEITLSDGDVLELVRFVGGG